MTHPKAIPDPISCDSNSKFYSRWAHLVEVYIDGHRVKLVTEASRRLGYAIVLLTDEQGNLVFDPDNPDKMMSYRREGKVELCWRDEVGSVSQ